MDFTSLANQIINLATGGNNNGSKDKVAADSNRILAIKNVSNFGYIIRTRIDGLIRYYSVTHDAATHFPEGWETGNLDPSAIIPPRTFSDDVKCIHLRKPSSITEFLDKTKPAHLRPSAQYPIAVEPLVDQKLRGIQDVKHSVSADHDTFVKLGKISTPRFTSRGCDDRLNIVRHPRINNNRPMVMKIVEFPDTWKGAQQTQGSFVESPELNIGSDRSEFTEHTMWKEIRMHQKVSSTASLDGLAPKFLGLVTERGRGVIGFVSEFVQDAKSFREIFRQAYAAGDLDFQLGEGDRRACRAALERLHGARLHHGDLHSGNVLRLSSDGSVRLIDFEETYYVDRDGFVFDSHESVETETAGMERWLDWTAAQWRQRQPKASAEVD
ncbi:hypothetical protein PG984_005331 [Apiospora sp. TS-2023a]